MDDPARKLPSLAPSSDQRPRLQTGFALRYRACNLPLVREQTLIGRSGDCDIVVDNSLVSRRHAQLVISGEMVTIEDLGSRNGVFVNDRPVQGRVVLNIGDNIALGDEILELVAERSMQSERVPRRERVTLHKHPAVSVDAPGDDDDGEETELTRRATVLELLSSVFEKALALGRGDEAERVMSAHLQSLLQKAEGGNLPAPETAATAAGMAVKIAAATGKPAWFDYAVQLYRLYRRPLPLPIIDELYDVLRRISGVDQRLLREYIAELRASTAQLTAPERFALQRLEGLERIASL